MLIFVFVLTVAAVLAAEYFERLKAPKKELI